MGKDDERFFSIVIRANTVCVTVEERPFMAAFRSYTKTSEL